MARIVSDVSQQLFCKLVAWECFGAELDPKELLREVPLEDLKKVSANIKAEGAHLKTFTCVSMVELELLFKSGLLTADWNYLRDGDRVTLSYEPISYPKQEMETRTTDLSFDNMPVGASA